MDLLVFLVATNAWAAFAYRYSRVAFLVLFGSYLTAFYVLVFGVSPVDISIADIMFIVFLISYGAKSVIENRYLLPLPRYSVVNVVVPAYVAVMALLPAVVGLVGSLPSRTVTPGLRNLQYLSLFPVTAHVFHYEDVPASWLYRAVTVIVSVNMSVAIFQYFGLDALVSAGPGPFQRVMIAVRPTGLLANPNVFGVVMTLLSFVAVSLRRDRGTTDGLLILVAFLAGFLSGSRTAVVVAGVLCVVYYARYRSDSVLTQPGFLLAAIAGGAVLGVTGWLARSRIVTAVVRLFREGTVSSLTIRFDLWERAIRLYWTNGAVGVPPTVAYEGLVVDNFYLSVLLQAGVPGLVIVVALYLYVLRTATASFERLPAFAGAMVFVTVGIVIGNMTMEAGNAPGVQVVFWTVLGALVGKVSSMSNRENEHRQTSENHRRLPTS
jgi:O-antigen ligase